MTPLEKRAIDALSGVSMRSGSNGKRFRRDIEFKVIGNPDLKLTTNQAIYLWRLCYTYRRQIKDDQIKAWAQQVEMGEPCPQLFQPENHAETKMQAKVDPSAAGFHVKPQKPTRYERELEHGGGRLAL